MSARRVAVLLLVACLGMSGPVLAQCAMCKATLSGSAEGRAIAHQLNEAILVMFFAPYLVCGAFVLVAFRTRIRARVVRAWRRFRERGSVVTRPLAGLP